MFFEALITCCGVDADSLEPAPPQLYDGFADARWPMQLHLNFTFNLTLSIIAMWQISSVTEFPLLEESK